MGQPNGQPAQPGVQQLSVQGAVIQGNVILMLGVGMALFQVGLGTDPDQADRVADFIAGKIREGAAELRRQKSGIQLPGMPGFPLGQFPGAERLPEMGAPGEPPPGHPDRMG